MPVMIADPLHFLLMVMAGWVNRRQLEVIDYLQEENRGLREQLGGKRLRFADDQRRRLAVTGQALGRRVLDELAGLVTPETTLRWYRDQGGGTYSADDPTHLPGPFRSLTRFRISAAEIWRS